MKSVIHYFVFGLLVERGSFSMCQRIFLKGVVSLCVNVYLEKSAQNLVTSQISFTLTSAEKRREKQQE